ncbi:hypothetical protein RJ639_008327 [Escallonia herrerae]|uniref:Protein kinase domain-containing protein n=1 Tax=Escallonia herrerae TaxID=1293975 RepID=A0AA89ASP7_9ASTE|nr:hypothetical protein RJ639_008327 [Escallonia herrerae]
MMEPGPVKELSYKDLELCTDNFSKENYIGDFQFGKIYRGKVLQGKCAEPLPVTVKIWEVSELYKQYPGDNELRMLDELVLLRHEKLTRHPVMVRLFGYCYEDEHFGVVYDLKSLNTVYNLVPKVSVSRFIVISLDNMANKMVGSEPHKLDNFDWLQRIKVIVGLAHLLKIFHARNPSYEPFLIRNIAASHIILDEDYNPKLCDFSMISGGIFPNRAANRFQYVFGCYGSIESSFHYYGKWSTKSDIFAFGVLLLNLITKRVDRQEERGSDRPFVYEWAQKVYDDDTGKLSRRSLVHGSLEADPLYIKTDGAKITKLAIQCVEDDPKDRPTIKQVVRSLMKLQIVYRDASIHDMDQIFRGHDAPKKSPKVGSFIMH